MVKTTLALWLLGFFTGALSANPYQGIRYAETEGRIYEHVSGSLSLAASTASWSTYTITMNGNGGLITASSATLSFLRVSTVAALSVEVTGTVSAAALTGNGAGITGVIYSTAAISASISALQTSTGAIQTELDALETQVAIDTTSLSAAGVLNTTNTWTAEQTFARPTTLSSATFSLATATNTFAGWVDVGWERVETGCTTAQGCAADCSAGKTVIGGGCYTTSTSDLLMRSYPSDGDTWNCYYNATVGTKTAYAICARIKP